MLVLTFRQGLGAWESCQLLCRQLQSCSYWSYDSEIDECELFDKVDSISKDSDDLLMISGPNFCLGMTSKGVNFYLLT